MNVIKYKYYCVVTNNEGVYLLFTYLGLPFRELKLGKIDEEEAFNQALTALQPEKLEQRDTQMGELLDLTSLIGSFIPLDEINPLRSLNMTVLNNTSQNIIDRLRVNTQWKEETNINVNDSVIDISYEYDPSYPNRMHGILLIKKRGSKYVHLYVMVEGNAILYVRYTDKDIEQIIELATVPTSIDGNAIIWSYDDNSNELSFGSQSFQYVPEKRGLITIDGFKLLYNGFYGSGTIQFNDYNYVPRKILVIPDKNWWKYTIFLADEPEVTYITSRLK